MVMLMMKSVIIKSRSYWHMTIAAVRLQTAESVYFLFFEEVSLVIFLELRDYILLE